MSTEEKTPEKAKPTCFVIMPISDIQGYESGHFGRVYEHLLKPAIISAGYIPVRADDTVKTDYIVVGIIQKIVESDIVICDLSAKNPNVMYELGIRHAFNKAVALVKDKRTDKVFDIQGLRYTEYDETLRIDSVQKDTMKICESIKETANTDQKGINSVVQLAGIKAAEVPAGQLVSGETQLILSAIAALEKRVDTNEKRADQNRYFIIKDDKVLFSDNSQAELENEVYDESANSVGVIVDIHPGDDKIFIKRVDGKVIPFSAFSVKSQGLTSIPF